MHELSVQESETFLKRFLYFRDAVVVQMQLSFRDGRTAQISLHAIDYDAGSTWTNVVIAIEDVEYFKWREDKQDLNALFFSLPAVIIFQEGLYFLAFEVDGNGDLYRTKDSVITEASILFAGRKITYEITSLPT